MNNLVKQPVRHGIPCSEESLKEHLKAFSDMEEAIDNLYKSQSQSLTKNKKSSKVSSKEKTNCENYTNTRKRQSKK